MIICVVTILNLKEIEPILNWCIKNKIKYITFSNVINKPECKIGSIQMKNMYKTLERYRQNTELKMNIRTAGFFSYVNEVCQVGKSIYYLGSNSDLWPCTFSKNTKILHDIKGLSNLEKYKKYKNHNFNECIYITKQGKI